MSVTRTKLATKQIRTK